MAELSVKVPIRFSEKAQRELYETCVGYKNLLRWRGAENDKLRELMKNALTALDNNCAECAYRDGCTVLEDCKCQAPDRIRDELRELLIGEDGED